MRKLIAIICLTTFVALQYGKIISYWQCRFMTTVVHCDCEKKLMDHHDEKEHSTPLTIAKEKVEEVYIGHAVTVPSIHVAIIITPTGSLYYSLIPADYTYSIFQPPRV